MERCLRVAHYRHSVRHDSISKSVADHSVALFTSINMATGQDAARFRNLLRAQSVRLVDGHRLSHERPLTNREEVPPWRGRLTANTTTSPS
jgi:hypothetical protein